MKRPENPPKVALSKKCLDLIELEHGNQCIVFEPGIPKDDFDEWIVEELEKGLRFSLYGIYFYKDRFK